jgi:hypothetical protein
MICIEPGIVTVVKAEHPMNALPPERSLLPLGVYPASIVTETSWVHPMKN